MHHEASVSSGRYPAVLYPSINLEAFDKSSHAGAAAQVASLGLTDFLFFLLLASLELSDTKVYEP